MRKMISLILALMMLLSVTTTLASAETAIVCPEARFSTTVDNCGYKWDDDAGLYIYAKQEGNIPYVLISTDFDDDRITDGATFLSDVIYPSLKDTYGAYGGTSFMGYGSFTLNGRSVDAAEYQFKDSAGYHNFLIYVVDVFDDHSVYYRVRFDVEEDRQMMLDMLETIAANAVIDGAAQTPQDEQTDEGKLREIHCEQAGFTTKVNFDHGTMWEDGVGLYIYTWGPDTIPYVLVNVVQADVADLNAYIRDTVTPDMKADYGDALRMYSEYEYLTIGGKDLPAASYTYDVNDSRITMLRAYDDRDGNIVVYTAKYVYEKDKQPTLDALDMIASNLVLDAQPTSEPAPKKTSGEGSALAFAVTNIEQSGMVMGRCTAPVGYEVSSQAFCNTEEQSAGCPWQLKVAAQSDAGCLLTYQSAREYIANATGTTEDGTYNMTYFTPMLHYMTAPEYCDYIASQLTGNVTHIEVVEENTYPELQPELRAKEAASMKLKNSQLNPLGMSIDKEVIDYCTRRYYVETDNGLKFYYCVATGTAGSWMTATMNGPIVSTKSTAILWDVPYVYTMLCPAYLWDEQGAAFETFVENTSVSDQFLLANQKLSQDLWDIITGRKRTPDLDEYSRSVMRDATDEGSDYDDERFTDYIFDQNDYTLSDGSHVKVSTSYDYVAEGDNGNVYYSNSLDGIPQWATQLTPNR